jgi:hypothetical protein
MRIRNPGSVMEKIWIQDQGSGMEKIWIRDPGLGMEKIWIRDCAADFALLNLPKGKV